MNIKIKIPASSANLGSGFDCLSLGLNLYNQYEVKTHTKKNIYTTTPKVFLKEENNLFLKAYNQNCESYGLEKIPFHCHCTTKVPPRIGLGSSANSILAGIFLSRIVHKKSFNREQILEDALRIEEHPDNLAGSLYGGFNICITKKGETKTFHQKIEKNLHCILVQMASTTTTLENRKMLPTKYLAKEVIHNLSRTALLGMAFTKQDFSLLAEGLEDELHQKYRIPNHLEIEKLKKNLYGEDYFGLALSGSGPSFIIFCSSISQRILCVLDEYFSKKEEPFKIFCLKVDNQGAQIEV